VRTRCWGGRGYLCPGGGTDNNELHELLLLAKTTTLKRAGHVARKKRTANITYASTLQTTMKTYAQKDDTIKVDLNEIG
jgi:hypothetical protein